MTNEDVTNYGRAAAVVGSVVKSLSKVLVTTEGAAEAGEEILDLIVRVLDEAEQRGAEREREACAKLCETWTSPPIDLMRRMAIEIRARGEEKG